MIARTGRDKECESDYTVALAGNPNVGKSTLFNSLTGMRQHTGNWSGKTVELAYGFCRSKKYSYKLVDLPGTYSLKCRSPEEQIAADFICHGGIDAVIVVCDATCLERNLNLALQIAETGVKTLICVNLMDEAKRKHIEIDLDVIAGRLGVPLVGTVARKKRSLDELLRGMDALCEGSRSVCASVRYPSDIEERIAISGRKTRYEAVLEICDSDDDTDSAVARALVETAAEVCRGAVRMKNEKYGSLDRRLDRIFTSRKVGYPIMLLLLMLVLWLTIFGANYPSDILGRMFSSVEDILYDALTRLRFPALIRDALVQGVWRVLSRVVSVMLPPMAIFFPFFTILEDSGYLPRIAYNLDKQFKCCGACGKQALSMCMGFGCNAAGVVGCRIIDSPRERLIAVITNSLVPCNGRFPMMISIITMFFSISVGAVSSLFSALILTAAILFGVMMTFVASKILSATLLRGSPSSFSLELPPYRRPQIGRVIVRSVFDRTIFVLGRSVAFAAPAGLVIWMLSNITAGEANLLSILSELLDPLASVMGLDGTILLAFIIGLPANEIVIPIMIMIYTGAGTILDAGGTLGMAELFISRGWTIKTAVCVMIFTLAHWPCSTTLMTVKKETGSIKWTVAAALVPTAIGAVLCMLFNFVFSFFA